MRKAVTTVLLLAVLGLGIYGGYKILAGRNANTGAANYATAEAKKDRIETKVAASGVVEPQNRDSLKISGRETVKELLMKENSIVKKGDRLVTFASGRNTIIAPYDGVIAKVLVGKDDPVTGGQPLLEIFDNRNYLTTINVDELDLPAIKHGQKAQITVNAFPNASFSGKVTDINQEGKTNNGVSSFPVTIAFEEIGNIRAGMTTEATIVTAAKDDALVVPIEAVSIVDGEKSVLLVKEDGTIENKKVETGIYSNTMVEITAGITEGDRVRLPETVSDQFNLIPGGFSGGRSRS